MTDSLQLNETLAQHALASLGHFALTPEDGLGTGTLILIGPDEPAFWPLFRNSNEYRDGADDPLDRWSHRVLTGVANMHDGKAYFPFGTAPYHPFYSWALRTGRAWPSPIQFLVHDTAGLFVSYRGAIVVPDSWPVDPPSQRPCDTCEGQPCKSACPVGAFVNGYDVPRCKAHVTSDQGTDCRHNGCLARRACPIGQTRRLSAQSAFHMEAFL